MDICGPLKTAKIGNNVVLVITDHFSKYMKTFTLPHQKAARIAEVIWNKWFHVHGEPQEKHTEKGPNFKSELIRQVCELHGITKTRYSPYHTQGDGQDERFNKNMMNIVLFQKADEWDEVLPFTASAYNSAVHEITAFTPNYSWYGRELRELRHTVVKLFPNPREVSDVTYSEYVKKLKEKLEFEYHKVRRNLKRVLSTLKIDDRNMRFIKYREGQQVIIRDNTIRPDRIQALTG